MAQPQYSSIPIDPVLLQNSPALPRSSQDLGERSTNILATATHSGASPPISSGSPTWSKEEYQDHLTTTYKRKDALQAECDRLSLKWGKKDTLERIRGFLIDHWYPSANPVTPPANRKTRRKNRTPQAAQLPSLPLNSTTVEEGLPDISDAALLAEFNVAGTAPEELLGYDDEDEDEEPEDLADDKVYAKFQKQTRVEAAERFEGNRRAGGRKTQTSIVKSWNMWLAGAIARKEVRDNIVDEHSLLRFIKYSAERPKLTRSGAEMPGTRIGASQIKKLFFGALRIRKTQEAVNPKLKLERPCATVLVYDETKTRMDQACERERSGLLDGVQDAPDIIANTFLSQVTDEQLKTIGYGLLEHRELHQVLNGHLAWTCQNASGNRGDDFRALKLCEMQPYVFLHPNKETSVYCVLGLQGEEKAGKKGMKTIINPSYTTFIAHRNPELCPLGALALYLHWLHDHYGLTEKVSIDWALNKSWRNIRLLFGMDPTVPYNENSLYTLYCMAYKKAAFESNIKQHLPRHMLGYLQERMGVDTSETAKLGWSRGTYMDTYAPALPKVAILGTHGYKVHENYDPIWRHVRVPEGFLKFMCPEAEGILDKIEGAKNLTGASNYWQMIIELRPYLFQCAAALFQVRPKSALFRLPALQRPEVQKWMREVYPIDLKRLQDSEKTPLDLSRIQNEALRLSLEEVRAQLETQNRALAEQGCTLNELLKTVKRRTALLSPAKAYVSEALPTATPLTSVAASISMALYDPNNPFIVHADFIQPPPVPQHQPVDSETRASEDTGVYELNDSGNLRAFISPSPARKNERRVRTTMDLILPPKEAFHSKSSAHFRCHVVIINLEESVMWGDVFPHIADPKLLFDVWKPSKTLDTMTLKEVWNCWTVGELVFGANPGHKPPIRLIEQHFKAKWRHTGQARKFWRRFREIPEWIEKEVQARSISPEDCIQQLEMLRTERSTRSSVNKQIILTPLGLNALAKYLGEERKKAAATEVPDIENDTDDHLEDAASTTGPSQPATGEPTPTIPEKRRAPAVGSRAPKAKKAKTHP
ncbi:hypothetical protein B0H16DRAFT_1714643 [Mycena metata]|uniref:Ndc10 domain-containing protein n=1 Tax=Mycena metata TaxID=1033252 RepID=A0AAD7NS76_9AGAR|nr:hypothetical protein B0H16DRAFT_1714643 [Mycena metata]